MALNTASTIGPIIKRQIFCSIGFGSPLQASPMMTLAAARLAGDSARAMVKLAISKHMEQGSAEIGDVLVVGDATIEAAIFLSSPRKGFLCERKIIMLYAENMSYLNHEFFQKPENIFLLQIHHIVA